MRLLCRRRLATIAAGENADAFAFGEQSLRDPKDHRRLAGPADGEIADADDEAIRACAAREDPVVGVGTKTDDHFVGQRERPEQGVAEFHAGSSGIRKQGGDALEARSVAPRLRSQSSRATLSHALRKLCLSSINCTQTFPSCGPLVTWIPALAARNWFGHVAKIFHGGPNTGGFENQAGSRMLWPPEGTSEPPTKTASASEIEACEFADGIEHQHVGILVEWRLRVDAAAADDGPAAGRGDVGGDIEAVRLARREDEQGATPLALHDIVGGEHGLLFLSHNAAGDEHRPALLLLNLPLKPCRPKGPIAGGVAIVFQIADDFDAISRRRPFREGAPRRRAFAPERWRRHAARACKIPRRGISIAGSERRNVRRCAHSRTQRESCCVCASRRKLGQISVSMTMTRAGRMARRARRTVTTQSSGK